MAEIKAWISVFLSILSMRAHSTLRILPRMGRIACVRGSRADTAEPPAESPSTMNSSRSPRSLAEQSLSLSGMPAPSRSVLERMALRAFLAASRAWAAEYAFLMTLLPSVGFSSNHWARYSLVTLVTRERMDVLPSLALRSEEHTSELQSILRISSAVFCLKKKKTHKHRTVNNNN